ncbi:Signal recognition particle subunit SRP72 [Fulvia fulva]|uniref:Signal recognition particle subunit SRP72 n=1 Tax=Passalora fulva TaxID=5499 RepID=A0A9Q8LHP1_PASFU|nr:Signal recognition particle subunit SRP72 [Fulvia fulva]KAK4623944.1 Signal recognition particle subunit SRP72 [Fulvia fulva]KAK4624905.1 Signal recognition particle subunit SRP72 [Fulvia fulva]UJO17644.1 Signal recognition particle subunit SRP72 [Fulvia fulva]WPV15432.1 Signal recognition particle subunit SRP72 [Fulvia fulva]WPV29615.1 Signal recognition particle subunit SRP72 [Fulvia fulva]
MSVSSLASLLKQTHIADDAEYLKAADAALKQSKTDLEAQHVKVVALLKLDRFEDALRAFEAGGDKLKARADLEYCYALYKSGRQAEAAELAQQNSARGSQHVEAQARYRTEDFARAAALYKQLAANPGEDAEADLRINTGAVDAQLEWSGRGNRVQNKKPGREDLEAFETAYNAACGSIARGGLGQGEVLLKRAKGLCSALEDLSEEEKQAELVPITVQQVYVLSKLGRESEAEALAQEIDAKAISDLSTRHIAQVNDAAARPTQNQFLAQRLVTKDLESLKPDYPFEFQSAILKRNKYASELQSLKYAGTASSTALSLAYPLMPNTDAFHNSLSAINAAAHAKGQTGKEALKLILTVLERRPNDVGLLLTIAQLYVLTGNSASAISLLEGFFARLEQSSKSDEQDVRFAPGLVGAMVSLYDQQGRKGNSRTELAKAVTHWRRKTKEPPAGWVHLYKAAGSALLESQDPEHLQLAREAFEELHGLDKNDRYAAAGLLAASPETTSKDQLASLTPIDRLIGGIDVDALESAGIALPPSAATTTTSRKRPAEDTKPKKAKKIRPSRMPKDFVPNKKPDPERWLPLKDRSTYRPKGKKAKARQALYSQGAVANESESSRPATPGGEVVKQKQQPGGGGANKKKKGKGGKW